MPQEASTVCVCRRPGLLVVSSVFKQNSVARSYPQKAMTREVYELNKLCCQLQQTF